MLNLAPLPFERVVGLYIATLFCIWQVVTFVSFQHGSQPPDPGGWHTHPSAAVSSSRFGGTAQGKWVTTLDD